MDSIEVSLCWRGFDFAQILACSHLLFIFWFILMDSAAPLDFFGSILAAFWVFISWIFLVLEFFGSILAAFQLYSSS